MTQKKLRFEDLQPHVEMLCDAVENKGASSSGIPHGAYECANIYRDLLERVRTKNIHFDVLAFTLNETHATMLLIAGGQNHRLKKLGDALDFYIKKEYYKTNNDE